MGESVKTKTMKKTLKKVGNTKSIYKLQPNSSSESENEDTEDSNNRITPEHPIYEDMIVQVLENQTSKNGMSRELLLKRIKQIWKVKTRYANPAIRNALKELRNKKRVKRSVEGLYKKVSSSRPASARSRPKSAKL